MSLLLHFLRDILRDFLRFCLASHVFSNYGQRHENTDMEAETAGEGECVENGKGRRMKCGEWRRREKTARDRTLEEKE